MQTRLAPIDTPRSWFMKLAYWYSKRRLGVVMTPLRVLYARLPIRFALWLNRIQAMDRTLALPTELALLVRILVAQRNTCHFCIDIARAEALKCYANPDKCWDVLNYAESRWFTPAERAVLAFADALTQHRAVPDATYANLAAYCTERQQVEVAWVVASEHVYNLMNLAFHIESDGLCQRSRPARSDALVPTT